MRPFIYLLAMAVIPLAAAKELTLGEATAEALANNPRIHAAQRKWKAALARVPQAKAWEDPRLSYDNVAGRFVQVPANAFTDQALSVEQLLPVSGKNMSRARVAAAEALVSYEEMRRVELDVASGVKSAWYAFLSADELLRLNQADVQTVEQATKGAAAKYQSGTETAPGAIQSEIEGSKLVEARLNLERSRSQAQTRLNVLMNRVASEPLDVKGGVQSAQDLDEKTLATLMLVSRPEIRMAMNRLEAERARVQLAMREWITDPAVNATAERYNGAAQAVSQVGVGISVSIPWVNPGKYREGVNEANENLAAAEADLMREKADALGMLRDQLKSIETAHHHYELYSGKILTQARQAFDAAQVGYSSGKATFADWLSAQRTLREVQGTAAEMQADYRSALADLEALVGTTNFAPPEKVHHHK